MNIKLLQKLIFAALISSALTACGGGSKKHPPVIGPDTNVTPVIETFTARSTTVTVGTRLRFDWKVADSDNDAVSCKFDPLGNGEVITIDDCLSTKSITYVYTALGTYKPRLTATDVNATSSSAELSQIVTEGPAIYLNKPLANEVINQQLLINVNVASEYEINNVTARIANNSIPLQYDATATCGRHSCPGFTGTLDLTGVSEGEQTLEISAFDSLNRQATYSEQLIYDNPPTLTISTPASNKDIYATPLTSVAASCSDTGEQGCSIRVFVSDGDNKSLAYGNGSINQSIDLGAYKGKKIELVFSATDSRNQTTQLKRGAYVDNFSLLSAVATVDGTILDAKDNRLLYKTSNSEGDSAYIFDWVQNVTTNLSLPSGAHIQSAYLSNFGAMLVVSYDTFLSTRVYDWNRNNLYDLGYPNSDRSLQVSGDYAIWSDSLNLIYRNLDTLSNSTLSTSAGNWLNSVASNGVVAWWDSDNEIYVYDGNTTQITNDPSLLNTYVLTDGHSTVYRKHTSCCTPPPTYAIVLFNGTTEVTLREANLLEPLPSVDYQIRNGWVLYTDISNQGQRNIWSYDPQGQKVQRTFFGYSSRVDALGDDGQVMIVSDNNKRYLSTGANSLVEVNSALGKSYFINNQWYVAIGGYFFSVNLP